MKKIILTLLCLILLTFKSFANTTDKFYKKIDLFSEVIEKVTKDYVDEVDQSEMMDSAINVCFNLLILIQLI